MGQLASAWADSKRSGSTLIVAKMEDGCHFCWRFQTFLSNTEWLQTGQQRSSSFLHSSTAWPESGLQNEWLFVRASWRAHAPQRLLSPSPYFLSDLMGNILPSLCVALKLWWVGRCNRDLCISDLGWATAGSLVHGPEPTVARPSSEIPRHTPVQISPTYSS